MYLAIVDVDLLDIHDKKKSLFTFILTEGEG